MYIRMRPYSFFDSSKISLPEISGFLRSLPCHKAELVPCGSETLDETIIMAIEASVAVMLNDKVSNHPL